MPLLKEEYRKEEKINGVIYDMSPSPNYQHGMVDGNIYRIISTGLQGTLCLAFMENLDYKYHAQESNDYVIPDVMIICDRDKLYKNRIYGAPDFILEVLSKSTRRRDMVIKLQKYANAGVKEYWMVDIEGRRVFVYIFDEENYPVIYGFDSKVPVYIWGGQCEIDFSEVYNYIRFLIES